MRARERIRDHRRWGCGVARAAAFECAGLVAVASLAAIALSASAGAEAAPDRAEYVSRLESICKPGVEATQRAVRGVRSDIKAERLAIAAGKLCSAARIFDGTVGEISAVPRPPPTQPSSPSGSRYLRLQESYLAKAAAALRARAHRPVPAQRRALRPHRQSRQRRGDRLRLRLLRVQVLAVQLRWP